MSEFLLDLIFPKRCIGCKKFGDYICANCFATIKFSQKYKCPLCNKSALDGFTHLRCKKEYDIDAVISGVEYRGIIKKLINQLNNPPYLKDLTKPAASLLYEAIIQNESTMNHIKYNSLLTSVPLTKKTEQKRGYNQADLIAKQLSTQLNIPYKKLLRKKDIRHHPSTPTHNKTKNEENTFSPLNDLQLKNQLILLIDDLTLTGTTFRECAKILKKSGAKKVIGISFAKE